MKNEGYSRNAKKMLYYEKLLSSITNIKNPTVASIYTKSFDDVDNNNQNVSQVSKLSGRYKHVTTNFANLNIRRPSVVVLTPKSAVKPINKSRSNKLNAVKSARQSENSEVVKQGLCINTDPNRVDDIQKLYKKLSKNFLSKLHMYQIA